LQCCLHLAPFLEDLVDLSGKIAHLGHETIKGGSEAVDLVQLLVIAKKQIVQDEPTRRISDLSPCQGELAPQLSILYLELLSQFGELFRDLQTLTKLAQLELGLVRTGEKLPSI
jgi:hypothetical protein